VFVADAATWEVLHLNPIDLAVTVRVPVDPFPTGLGLAGNGKVLLVTHLFSGRVTAIDTGTMQVLGVASTGLDTNHSQSIALSPDGRKAYLPQTRSNTENLALVFDATVFPVVNVLDLADGQLLTKERVTLDTADQPVDLPLAVVLSPDGKTLYVANAGSNDISVIDLGTRRALAHLEVGHFPRGLALSADGAQLYVNNVLEGALTVIDTQKLAVEASIKLTTIPLSPQVLLGKRLFHSSATERLAKDQWISCAVCHFDGGHDARTWRAFPDGPRNTPALFGVGKTQPVHWSGDLDELQDVELTVRNIQAGHGLVEGEASDSLGPPHAGHSLDLDALADFMASLELPLSPCTAPSGVLTGEAARGQRVFGRLQCATCHAPPLYTDRRLHEVGTGHASLERNSHGRGTQFDTPSLLGIWATASYFHDGSAASLREVLDPPHPRRGEDPHAAASQVTAEELQQLVLFLQSLPFQEVPPEGTAPPAPSATEARSTQGGPPRRALIIAAAFAVMLGAALIGLYRTRKRRAH
jgi:YVTN family beta-propeller protein